ncbi:MAG TPA: hypothetical protein VFZ28_10960 [Burkholderiaceae bacterium]|nr:hypothetical protein [Burkholderiaceae bacterium]
MPSWRSISRRSAACAAALLAPLAASAQGADDWKFQGSLYLYLPSIGGTTTFPPSGGGSPVSIDGSRILEDLKFTFMGSLEAHRGGWGVFTDVIYLDFGDTKAGSRDIEIGGALPAGASAQLEYDLRGWLWALAGTWRAVSTPTYRLDVLGGTRMLDIKETLTWQLSGNVGSIAAADRAGERQARQQNWDAIVGVKGRAAFGEGLKWYVPYYLDLGAGESKFTWQAMTGIGYTFGWGDVVGAWRYVDYKMKSGASPIQSVSFNGPAVAAVFRW